MVNYDTLSVSSHLGVCLFNLIIPFVLIFVVQFVEGLLGKYISRAKEIHARPLSLATVEFCMAFRSRFLTLLWESRETGLLYIIQQHEVFLNRTRNVFIINLEK